MNLQVENEKGSKFVSRGIWGFVYLGLERHSTLCGGGRHQTECGGLIQWPVCRIRKAGVEGTIRSIQSDRKHRETASEGKKHKIQAKY